jgi:hypothetical protein
MARIPLAFDLMRRLFKVVQDEPNAVGLRFVQELVPVTVMASDAESVWIKVPLDAIMSYALPEASPEGKSHE